MYKGVIFDLDGVIVDTAKYHFKAWTRLAESLSIEFTAQDNERLKGVSRMRSLDILLEKSDVEYTQEEKMRLATQKNDWYVQSLGALNSGELLEGIETLLQYLKEKGIKMSLGSASKNAPLILEKLNLTEIFDAVVDGNHVSKAKPDPEVFLIAAEKLGLEPDACIVIEDAAAGVDAAIRAGMYVIGIGSPDQVGHANLCLPDTAGIQEAIEKLI